MKKYKWYIVMLGVIIILIIAFNIALHRIKVLKSNEGKIIRDTTIVIKLDTIKIIKPVYLSEKVVDTLLVPITDTLRINDTLYQPIPKTQREYKQDSLYRVLISGYNPVLDLIEVYPKTITNTITNTIYRKPSKIGFGIIGGYGLTFGNKVEIKPFVGAGIYYRIW